MKGVLNSVIHDLQDIHQIASRLIDLADEKPNEKLLVSIKSASKRIKEISEVYND